MVRSQRIVYACGCFLPRFAVPVVPPLSLHFVEEVNFVYGEQCALPLRNWEGWSDRASRYSRFDILFACAKGTTKIKQLLDHARGVTPQSSRNHYDSLLLLGIPIL